MGIYGMVQAISQAIAPAFGLALADYLSYRMSCTATAICARIGFLLILPLRDAHYEMLKAEHSEEMSFAKTRGKLICSSGQSVKDPPIQKK